jgi:acylphosphatase
MHQTTVKLKVHGKVQGVFYRKSTVEKAASFGLVGWVKNNEDGTVEILVQGPENMVVKMVEWCWDGPKNAVVTKVDQQEVGPGNYADFKVVR